MPEFAHAIASVKNLECDRAATACEDGVAVQVRSAAAAGDAGAQALYAQMLSEGRGVALDAVEALHWFALAANSGDAIAMNMLGRCHELGRGTPVNHQLAAAWYRKSATRGLDWGMYNYANLLRRGLGVKADRARALVLYQRAANLGHAKSMNLVGRYHDEGWGIPRDAAIAAQWYRRSAQRGDFRGQTSHASVLAQGGHLDAALAWLRSVAKTATPAFLERLAGDLMQSPREQLQRVGEEMRNEVERRRAPAAALYGGDELCQHQLAAAIEHDAVCVGSAEIEMQ